VGSLDEGEKKTEGKIGLTKEKTKKKVRKKSKYMRRSSFSGASPRKEAERKKANTGGGGRRFPKKRADGEMQKNAETRTGSKEGHFKEGGSLGRKREKILGNILQERNSLKKEEERPRKSKPEGSPRRKRPHRLEKRAFRGIEVFRYVEGSYRKGYEKLRP